MNKSLLFEDRDILAALQKRSEKEFLKKVLETTLFEVDSYVRTIKKGDNGYTPIKGLDYFTEEEIEGLAEYLRGYVSLVVSRIPIPSDGQPGTDGKPGKDGLPGKDADEVKIISTILKKLPELDEIIDKVIEKIPSPLTVEDIVKEIKKKKLIEVKDVKNMPLNMNDMRWHGGGLSTVAHDDTLTGDGTSGSPLSVVSSGGSGALTLLTATGDINDTNTDFTFTQEPLMLNINGALYPQATGVYNWSWSDPTATLAQPLGTGSFISGIASAGVTLLTATGTINDSNMDFTFTQEPLMVNINGALYPKETGIYNWTWSGLTMTLAHPIGTGGFIIGVV